MKFIALIFVFGISFGISSARRSGRVTREKSPKNVNGTVDEPSEGFGEWSVWSRCKRNCRQFRIRRCIDPEICEGKTQKDFRACQSTSCRQKMLMVIHNSNNRKPSKFKVLNHLTPYLYSEWSQWSPCSKTCFTRRTRTCRFPEICSTNPIKEDYKQCYREGDDCEKKYLERLQHIAQDHQNETTVSHGTGFVPSLRHPLDNITCGISSMSSDVRITGGRPVIKGSWPWQVLILNGHQQAFCGGVLLSSKWVLTAAHCSRRRMFVRTGEHDLSYFEDTEQQERVGSIFVFPDYDPQTMDNDLALLKMRVPFELNRYVQPICLPSKNNQLPFYARATILGWGKRRNFSSFGTDILHQAEVPVVPVDECRDSYDDYYISENMLCAGYENGKVDSCHGDSGGPLLHRRTDGTWAVYGITSFGDGCGQKRKYGVYANVLNHLSWIRDIVEDGEMEPSSDEGLRKK